MYKHRIRYNWNDPEEHIIKWMMYHQELISWALLADESIIN